MTRPAPADVLLVTAAVVAATCSWSTTARWFNLVAVAGGALAITAALTGPPLGVPGRGSVLLALAVSAVPQLARPPTGNVAKTGWYPLGIGLGLAALVLVAAAVALGRHVAPLCFGGLGVLGVACLATVAGGRTPAIDVWQIFQQSAAGLVHGLNPYDTVFTGVPPGQTADCFNYLPGTLLPTWFGWLVTGDVRYAEVAVLLAGWAALAVAVARRPGAARALPVLVTGASLAGTLRVAQQAWNESLVLGLLLLAAALLVRGRPWAAVLPLALALATKQHVALLLPLLALWPVVGVRRTAVSAAGAAAISLPWVAWNARRFATCTVGFFLDLRARPDSISLWHLLPGPLQTAAVAAGTAGGYALSVLRLPRTAGGLLLGAGVVLYGFDLANKQSFENQWWLACQLLVGGLALHAGDRSGQPAR